MKPRLRVLILVLLPLLCFGLPTRNVCDRNLQKKYCDAPYGGDFHTVCRYCGVGLQCPNKVPSGRGLTDPVLVDEILKRHNAYRAQVRQMQDLVDQDEGKPMARCIPELRWDDELARVAQVWSDQCASVIYFHGSDMYPKVFHERGTERTTEAFRGPPGVGQNIAWALTKDVNFTRIIDDLWYRDISTVQPQYIEDFQQIANHDRDMTLVTQILWGQTTHVGCGWTQFPVKDSSPIRMMNSGLLAKYGMGGENQTLYENFFVCNYGVGGNVLGEPVFNCNDALLNKNKPQGEPMKSMDGLASTVIKYQDQYQNASPETKKTIQHCLEGIICATNQNPTSNCSSNHVDCLKVSYDDLQDLDQTDLVAKLECQIGEILCSLAKSFSQCRQDHETCMLREINKAATTTTTTESPNLKGTIQSSTAMAPITKTMSTESSVGSSSFDVKSSTIALPNINVEVTTFSALNVELVDRPEGKDATNEGFESPTQKPEAQEFTPPAETEPSILFPTTSPNVPVTQSSLESENEFTPPSETEPPLLSDSKNISTQPLETGQVSEPEIGPIGLPKIELFPRIDMRFYNGSTRSEERLAFCLNSLECNPDDDKVDCLQLNLFCNQGLNVSGVNPKIVLKLSECMIQDIICFLQDNSYDFCRNRFESCADIILPSSVRISLSNDSLETNIGNLDSFIEITGISEISNQNSTIAGNVTNNVIESISQSLGDIELSELDANLTLDDIIADNETLKIYQDIHIILNDDPAQSNGTIVELTINGTKVQVDIDNPSIVLDPNSFIIGLENQTNIDDSTKHMLIEKVLNNFAAVGTVCALCGSANHSLSIGEDLMPETLEPNLGTVLIYPSPSQLQIQLSVCLSALSCGEVKSCQEAHIQCLGQDNFHSYSFTERKNIAECLVENFLCQIDKQILQICGNGFNSCLNHMNLSMSAPLQLEEEKVEQTSMFPFNDLLTGHSKSQPVLQIDKDETSKILTHLSKDLATLLQENLLPAELVLVWTNIENSLQGTNITIQKDVLTNRQENLEWIEVQTQTLLPTFNTSLKIIQKTNKSLNEVTKQLFDQLLISLSKEYAANYEKDETYLAKISSTSKHPINITFSTDTKNTFDNPSNYFVKLTKYPLGTLGPYHTTIPLEALQDYQQSQKIDLLLAMGIFGDEIIHNPVKKGPSKDGAPVTFSKSEIPSNPTAAHEFVKDKITPFIAATGDQDPAEQEANKIADSLSVIFQDDQIDLSAPITLTSDPKNNIIMATVNGAESDIKSKVPLKEGAPVTFSKSEIPSNPTAAHEFVKDKIKLFFQSPRYPPAVVSFMLSVPELGISVGTDEAFSSESSSVLPFVLNTGTEYPSFGFSVIGDQVSSVGPSLTSGSTLSGSLFETSTMSSSIPSEPVTSQSIIGRIRDIVLGLVASTFTGLMSQTIGLPISPGRKEDKFNQQRPLNAKDPFDRVRPTIHDEVYFDGNVLNITLPVKDTDVKNVNTSALENEVGLVVENVLTQAFKPVSEKPKIRVKVTETQDNQGLFINAEAVETLNPKRDPQNRNPSGSNIAQAPIRGEGRTPPNESPIPLATTQDPVGNREPGYYPDPRTTERPFNPALVDRFGGVNPKFPSRTNQEAYDPFGILDMIPQVEFGTPIDISNIRPIQFKPEDAIQPTNNEENKQPTRTFSEASPETTLPLDEEARLSDILDILLNEKGIDYINAVPDDDDQSFDNNLNILFSRESAADIVNATVVEDFDYARRIRDAKNAISFATISSIIIGAISLLLIGLVLFMIIARKRRRSYSTTTPTQSRTTITGTPIIVDTPSVSDMFNSGPQSIENSDPVMPIDGHQTIVTSYEEFMFSGGAKGNILNSMPLASDSGPSSLESDQRVPPTQDLKDGGDYLFARSRP